MAGRQPARQLQTELKQATCQLLRPKIVRVFSSSCSVLQGALAACASVPSKPADDSGCQQPASKPVRLSTDTALLCTHDLQEASQLASQQQGYKPSCTRSSAASLLHAIVEQHTRLSPGALLASLVPLVHPVAWADGAVGALVHLAHRVVLVLLGLALVELVVPRVARARLHMTVRAQQGSAAGLLAWLPRIASLLSKCTPADWPTVLELCVSLYFRQAADQRPSQHSQAPQLPLPARHMPG